MLAIKSFQPCISFTLNLILNAHNLDSSLFDLFVKISHLPSEFFIILAQADLFFNGFYFLSGHLLLISENSPLVISLEWLLHHSLWNCWICSSLVECLILCAFHLGKLDSNRHWCLESYVLVYLLHSQIILHFRSSHIISFVLN